jgi:hypothetical protein
MIQKLVAEAPQAPVAAPAPAPKPAPVIQQQQQGSIVIIDATQNNDAQLSRLVKRKLDERPSVPAAVQQQMQVQPQQQQSQAVDCSKYDFKNTFPTNLIDRIVCDANKLFDAARTLFN